MTEAIDGGKHLFIGWDVGGWNCEKNSKSRDALVVLDQTGSHIGKPWWGNLRRTINESTDTDTFLKGILALCGLYCDVGRMRATMAVDAPLGFPDAFVQLITKFTPQAQIDGESNQNSYLFRLNERRLASEGLVMPLSAIKDMIGSQSTKAMHVIAKFKLQGVAVGIWSDERLTMIETYPSLCRKRLKRQKPEHLSAKNSDICDSSLCSRIAHDFHFKRKCLESPPLDAPTVEGWIWAPLAT